MTDIDNIIDDIIEEQLQDISCETTRNVLTMIIRQIGRVAFIAGYITSIIIEY
jgi:hypothetical protein